MIYSNKDVYEGYWVDGKCEGHGKLIEKSGKWYNGEWKNNKYHGDGKEFIPKFGYYEG